MRYFLTGSPCPSLRLRVGFPFRRDFASAGRSPKAVPEKRVAAAAAREIAATPQALRARFDRTLQAPVLSPKKSVEGGIGGIVGSAFVGAAFRMLMEMRVVDDPNVIWVMAVVGAVGAVISQVCDLSASAIKRNYDIKDYGTLIPGHGGILDRFDSVIITAPIVYFLASCLLG